jgi:ADP-ribose pyrophosphatase
VECSDCVGILPFLEDGQVVMVRQYRYVFGENHRWEMPTGGLKAGETLLEAARRELREETSYDAGELEHISTYYTSKSIVREVAHLYLARYLVRVQSTSEEDETEFLETAVFPFERVLQMALDCEIRDSMTNIAILLAARRLGI